MADWLIRITQRWGGSNGLKWHTTYEATGSSLSSVLTVRPLADAIVRAHRAVQLNKVYIQSIGISSWVADSFPYDRTKFVNIPVGLFGTRIPVTDALPAETCLKLSRNPAAGRSGRVLLRGVLTEGDVSASNTGEYELTNASLRDMGVAPLSQYQAELAPYLAASGQSTALLAMIGRPKTSLPGVKPPTYGVQTAAILFGFSYYGVGNVNMRRDNDGQVGADLGDSAANKAVLAAGNTVVITDPAAAEGYVPNWVPAEE